MSNAKKCFHRDNKVIEYVKAWGFLSTDQIVHLCFSDTKTGKRVAQKRLKYLCDEGILHRKRVSFDEPYIYWYDQKKNIIQAAHVVATNWVLIMLKAEKLGRETMVVRYEDDYKILRTDCFVELFDDKEKKYRHYFIEADISHNDFDKIRKYNELFDVSMDIGRGWVQKADRFPCTIIVTHRKKTVERRIIRENKNKLEFKVYDYDQLRRFYCDVGNGVC